MAQLFKVETRKGWFSKAVHLAGNSFPEQSNASFQGASVLSEVRARQEAKRVGGNLVPVNIYGEVEGYRKLLSA